MRLLPTWRSLLEVAMTRSAVGQPGVARISRHLLVAGAGSAVLWCFALLAWTPAPVAAAEGGRAELRGGTFGSAAGGSAAGRPLRRRAPGDYHRQAPYGFLTLGGGVFDPATQPGDGFYGVITGGTEVGPMLDLGISLSWYHRGSQGEGYTTTGVGPGGTIVQQTIQTSSVDSDLLPFMAIARVRLPITPYFQPYIGGGAGYEWLFIEGVDDQGYGFSYDYGGFGAQALAGLNIAASPSVSLYGEATYNFTTVEDEFYDPYWDVVVKESVEYNGIAYHGGLRFRF